MALADFRNSIVTQDKFSATFHKFDQGVQTSARGLDKLGAVMSSGGVGMLFGATAGVAGALAIGKTVWSLGELGAQSLTTEASFRNLMRSVGASPSLLDQMSRAAGGTITELQLMQSANTALAGTSGALSSELAGAIPKLIEAGRAAAMLNPSMGDAAFMTQSLITGIKRGSPMLIDNTGITLKLGEATEAYAASIGKSVAELTTQERSIAILRATMAGADTLIQQAGDSLDSMTSDIQRSKVAVEELKTAFGELAAPGVANAASNVAMGLQGITAALNNDRIAEINVDLAYYNKLLREAEAQTVRTAAGRERHARSIQILKDQISALNVEQQAIIAPTQNAARLTAEYRDSATGAAAASATFDDRLAGLIATARGGSAAMQSLIGYIQGVSAAASGSGTYTGFLGGVDVLSQEQYVNLTQQRIYMERALNVQVAANILTQQQADYQLAMFDKRINDHIGSLRTATTATGGYSSAMDTLKSKIGSALTPSFDLSGLTGGMLGGMGGDAFDEAYKRLAAVALRPEELQIHAGDWADTFAKAGLTGLSPEDAQARAKELVEAYSKGLDFSLIDKEKIKDSVRQAIKAEELYQSIVDEIYAEMGKPAPKLETSGRAMGDQIMKGTKQALKDKAPDLIYAIAEGVAPSVAAILRRDASRYTQ